MIISDKYRFIFIHLPKTGGSSLTWKLRWFVNNPNQIDIGSLKPIFKGWQGIFHLNGQHSGYIENEGSFNNKRDYFSFAFVRNSWSLIFSWYLALSRNSTESISPENFKKFLFNLPESHSYLILRPQITYICDRQGQIMLNHVARFEQYDNEVDAILQKLGITVHEKERLNVANKNNLHYHDYYDLEGRELVYERYQLDIEYFHYQF